MTTEQQIQYILDNCMKVPCKKMAAHIGRSDTFVRGVLKKHNIKVPRRIINKFKKESQFKKGLIPFNKGMKAEDFLSSEALKQFKKSQFKKGETTSIILPGTLSIRKHKGEEYWFLKYENHKWMQYHRYIYQQYHNIDISDYNIQFKDGNTLNCNIENLYKIKRSKQAVINKQGGRKLPHFLQDTIYLKSKINKKIKSHEKQTVRS